MEIQIAEQACHICDNETEFYCRDCEEPVCEDCCVPYDQFTQIEYTLCIECHEGELVMEECRRHKQWKIEDEKREKREHINKLAKARYWEPERVKKRRLERAKRKKEAADLAHKQLIETFKTVGRIFGNIT